MTSTQPRYKDIIKQIEELQKQADKLKAEERSKVLKEVREQIAVFEFTAGELGLKGKASLAGKKVPIRYTDDNGNTWSGRGHRPGWLNAAIENGRKLEDFLIAV
ncbi:H-NS histone family protein [Ralstonia pickettii]|uniref:H-NS histone family protein n=1 Tax=Ralstonia pickettii TaxID=329 RepID=A0AAW4Q9R0_RALPI|nr:H-NS histone family protein [Ralstonia pickettii]MBA9846844.1 H-NS histone family protein [Ralstonia pickettii]MBA9852004.1 H-NS histone family protein [Ralstonia pickettii]MBA9919981.1 H-NS histone family protein [Ralstonia pickettii]MBA9959083.1 H-NS histone family protein [Ralstonia pickettii]MBA9964539.1 H-NS histone family protein [Ralstonia pickettii]